MKVKLIRWSMWSRVCAVVVERERYPEYVLHPWFDEHGAGETGRRWTVNKRKFWDKIDIVPCTCEMVSISIYWTTCSASLMTTRRQIECNASNCIHKHFYRTSNPWSFIVLDTKKTLIYCGWHPWTTKWLHLEKSNGVMICLKASRGWKRSTKRSGVMFISKTKPPMHSCRY